MAQVNSPVLCDRALKGWYRFGGLAGNNMPTLCVPKNRCGTHASGWVTGGLPTARYQLVNRKVCFHWGNKCCNWNTNIRVRNCGGFNVYYLSKPPACSLRYCGNRRGMSLKSVYESPENESIAEWYEHRRLEVKSSKRFSFLCFPYRSFTKWFTFFHQTHFGFVGHSCILIWEAQDILKMFLTFGFV